MGIDPHTSAVSPRLQHWDAESLFVAGAFNHPFNAGYNPTGPLGALALRLGDDLHSYVEQPRALQSRMNNKQSREWRRSPMKTLSGGVLTTLIFHSVCSAGGPALVQDAKAGAAVLKKCASYHSRSEEHTSELQSLMRISYAVFCLKKKRTTIHRTPHHKTNNNRK